MKDLIEQLKKTYPLLDFSIEAEKFTSQRLTK